MDNSKFRKMVKLPISGAEFEIRRIDPFEYSREIGELPLSILPQVSKELSEGGEQTEVRAETRKTVRFFLEHAVVSPKVWFGPDEECPEGQVIAADLGIEKWILMAAIVEYSDMVGSMEKMSFFFRGIRTTLPGYDSETVRDNPVGANADGSEGS